MRLIAIATARDITLADSDRVLRLVGMPRADDVLPDDVAALADQAARRMRGQLPEWMWTFARESGLAALETWWYMPLSETSPQRSHVLRELYWLTLVRLLLQTKRFTELVWHGDDALIANAMRDVAAAEGVRITVDVLEQPRRSLVRALAGRIAFGLRELALAIAMRVLRFAKSTRGAQALLYTRFPVLWERDRERMYGTWPDHLEAHGKRCAYLALYSGGLGGIAAARRAHVVFALRVVSLAFLIRAHFSPRVLLRYASWRRRVGRVDYDGFEVGALLRRELDRDALSVEVPQARLLAEAVATLVRNERSIRDVFYPFEFQPPERALTAGARRGGARAIGLQTGLFTSNQFGFLFPPGLAAQAPMPDLLAAYGELPYKTFARQLGADRVVLSGPIRYPTLLRAPHERKPVDGVRVLVTTSTIREESLPLLESAFAVAARHRELSLVFRFHYHLLLHAEVAAAAAKHGVAYAMSEGTLHDELLRSTAIVTGGSSTGIEAIALGCMPLVYRTIGRMDPNPMIDVPDAVFFWQTADDLDRSLQSVTGRDADFESRRRNWPDALRAHLGDGQRDPNECLYQRLYND